MDNDLVTDYAVGDRVILYSAINQGTHWTVTLGTVFAKGDTEGWFLVNTDIGTLASPSWRMDPAGKYTYRMQVADEDGRMMCVVEKDKNWKAGATT